MQFVQRAKRTETETAILRRWRALDAPRAVVEINSKFGLPKRYVVVDTDTETIVSRHRSRAAAFTGAST